MKKTIIKFEYSEEKLLALNSYLEKKDTNLNAELEDVVEKLYEKFVPNQVREFIEVKEEMSVKKPKKVDKTVISVNDMQKETVTR